MLSAKRIVVDSPMIPSQVFDALVEPIQEGCTKKNVLVPRCIVPVAGGCAKLWVVNTSNKAAVLPKGLKIASFHEYSPTTISALTDARVHSPASHSSEARLLEMIAKFLRSDERRTLVTVLSWYSTVFDFSGTQTTLSIPASRTHHATHTGLATLIRWKAYRVS